MASPPDNILSQFSTRELLEHLSTRNIFGFRQRWCSECCSLDIHSERGYCGEIGCADNECAHDYGGDYPIYLCDRCQEKYEICFECDDDNKLYCEKARTKCDKCEEWLCRNHKDVHKC